MARIKREPPRIPTPEESVRISELEAESDRVLDWLSSHGTGDGRYRAALDRLNYLDVKIATLKGEGALEVNEDFRR